MSYIILASYAAVHIAFFIWTFRWGGNGSARIWFLRVMLLAMAYDNSVMVLGAWYIESSWYLPVNYPRYLLHAGVLPFLTLFAFSVMEDVGVPIAERPAFKVFCRLFTLFALGYGLWHEVYLLELMPTVTVGVQKLTSTSDLPPIATIMTNLLVLPMAATVWKVARWKWLFLGGLFILLVNSATSAQEWGFLAGNFAELVFVFSLLMTEKHFRQHLQI